MQKGLHFHKMDLHIHTPASRCFKDKNITEREIVQAAFDKGLSAIAITDHNTGAWIDKVKKEGLGKGLVVFPGVEISATGGGEGTTHIVGIFDTSKGTKDIENLLGNLGIPANKYGAEDAFTALSPSEVIDRISKNGGLAVAAHANSTHGLLEWRGIPRIETIQNPRLMAMEATDFENEQKMKNHKRVVDLLDGTDPSYKRKLAVYQASDNPDRNSGDHCITGIGTRYSYFKMDEISLEGLRQCFSDPDVRIKNTLQDSSYPRIESLKVEGGFLDKKEFFFHSGLNAFLGGKGVGKSLTIEFLRFALDQQSEIPAILKDAEGKLEERLGMFGKIEVNFALENGDKFKLTRTYDGSANKIECVSLETFEHYQGEIRELFPILGYSQTEIIEIARNKNAQLDLIDNFISATKFKRENKTLSKLLSENDTKLAEAMKSSYETLAIKEDLDGLNYEIKSIDKSLKHRTFDEYKSWERRKKIFESKVDYHEELIKRVDEFIEIFETEFEPDELDTSITDRSLKAAVRKVSDSYGLVMLELNKLKGILRDNKTEVAEKLEDWVVKFKTIEKKYQIFISERGDKKKLEGKRRGLEIRKDELEGELRKHKVRVERLVELRSEREDLLGKLEDNNKNFFEERQNAFKELEKKSDMKLSLTIKHAANREKFKSELITLAKGSRIRETDIELVSENMTPRSSIGFVVDNKPAEIASTSGIKKETAEKLCSFLMSKEDLQEVLAIQHKAYPEDVPSIGFKKQDGKYYELAQLSVGQKCSALVIIALAKGKMPLIIDQPEDSLDIKSVWEDVGQKLREGKENKQFILTTHNPNIAVASDADMFHILDSNADRAELVSNGGIEREEVKEAVIIYLEGGPDPYNLRRRKYHLKDSLQ